MSFQLSFNSEQKTIDVTKILVEVGKIVGIEVLDHIIIDNSKYLSLKEKEDL
jgi:DNA repair protein RadC